MKSGLKALAGYGAAAALSLLLVAWALRLWEGDLRVPISYHGDALLIQTWVKGVIDNGWYLRNQYLGAPGGLDMHDFPLDDALFIVLLKLIALGAGEAALTCNLFFLLTFPLSTVSSLWALRRFGVSYGPALVASLLFAFLPYHFLRGPSHLFLAAYFLVPPLAAVALWLYQDAGLFFRRDGGAVRWSPFTGRTLAALFVCALAGSGGAYYAFFACYLLAVAGLACCLRQRRAYPLGAAALLVAVIAAGVALNVAPNYLYTRAHGRNADLHRHPADADLLGMKVAQLLLPVEGHRLPWLARARARYKRYLEPGYNENSFASLGLAGSLGFLYLLSRFLSRDAPAAPRPHDGLSSLTLAALLLGTVGGFGSLFNIFVTPWIRGYNRISVFVGFFALFAVALLLDKAAARFPSRRGRLLFHAFLGLVLLGGLLDQVPPAYVPGYVALKAHFDSNEEFVARIEATLPPGAMVFQVPSVPFPEADKLVEMAGYDQFRAYLHSHALRWSHGTMRGRDGDGWRARVGEKPPPELVRTLVLAGFSGIYVERNGFSDRGAWLEGKLAGLLGPERMLVSGKYGLSFFDLRGYAGRLRERYTPEQWSGLREEAMRPVSLTWQPDFYPADLVGTEVWRWAAEEGKLLLNNPLPRPRKVVLTMNCATGGPGPAPLRVRGPAGESEWAIDHSGRPVTLTLELPPGEHTLTFACNAPRLLNAFDPRALVFRITDFSVKDVAD